MGDGRWKLWTGLVACRARTFFLPWKRLETPGIAWNLRKTAGFGGPIFSVLLTAARHAKAWTPNMERAEAWELLRLRGNKTVSLLAIRFRLFIPLCIGGQKVSVAGSILSVGLDDVLCCSLVCVFGPISSSFMRFFFSGAAGLAGMSDSVFQTGSSGRCGCCSRRAATCKPSI
jgi:hypothetical protein